MSISHPRWRNLVRCLATLVLALQWVASASPGAPLATVPVDILPKTTSPNGRYAIGWSMHGVSAADWAKLRPTRGLDADGDLFDRLCGEGYDHVENYLVFKKTGHPLAFLKGIHYWELAGYSTSHRELIVAWSKNAERVLVIDDARFSWSEVLLAELEGDQVVSSQLVGDAIKQITLKALSGKFRHNEKFIRDKNRLGFYAEQAKFLTPDRIWMKIQAFHPKTDADEDSFAYAGEVTLKLSRQGGSPISLGIESLQ